MPKEIFQTKPEKTQKVKAVIHLGEVVQLFKSESFFKQWQWNNNLHTQEEMDRESTLSKDVIMLRNAKQIVEVNMGDRKTKTWQENDTAEPHVALYIPDGKGMEILRKYLSMLYSELKGSTG